MRFFEILRKKEKTFKNSLMAKEILTRVFDNGLLQEIEEMKNRRDKIGTKKRILTKEEIKELEKVEQANIL